jgi:polysaccharide biosynthesis transport protein
MVNPGGDVRKLGKARVDSGTGQVPLPHYLRLIRKRMLVVLGIWLLASGGTIVVARLLPDTYTSETLILVDPQKVPETYVKSTITGDVRNRLSTLSQSILSATNLQKIIDALNLYPEDKKKMAREDVLIRMRNDITVRVVSDFGASQDFQAFRIAYSGHDPGLVAQVTNRLADLFIEGSLTARQNQATGTTEFLTNQLQETRKALEQQEAKLKDFKLKHVGEMPQQQDANLQLLGQAQSQLQIVAEALNRAEQQRSFIQATLAQSAPVADIDDGEAKVGKEAAVRAPKPSAISTAKLAALLTRYGDKHPDIQRLKRQIEEEEAAEAKEAPTTAAADPTSAPALKRTPRPVRPYNPVLESQLSALNAEIKKHQEDHQRLSKVVGTYRAKLDAVPLREQEITELERDYEISKAHYKQLLEQQLSAQTATQLEFRQKGEKFEILDRAQPAERPSKPNRVVIDLAGSVVGLMLGLVLAIGKEFVGMSIITPDDVMAASGLPVLGEIPVIQTRADRRRRRKRILMAASSAVAAAVVSGAILFYHYRIQT